MIASSALIKLLQDCVSSGICSAEFLESIMKVSKINLVHKTDRFSIKKSINANKLHIRDT